MRCLVGRAQRSHEFVEDEELDPLNRRKSLVIGQEEASSSAPSRGQLDRVGRAEIDRRPKLRGVLCNRRGEFDQCEVPCLGEDVPDRR